MYSKLFTKAAFTILLTNQEIKNVFWSKFRHFEAKSVTTGGQS